MKHGILTKFHFAGPKWSMLTGQHWIIRSSWYSMPIMPLWQDCLFSKCIQFYFEISKNNEVLTLQIWLSIMFFMVSWHWKSLHLRVSFLRGSLVSMNPGEQIDRVCKDHDDVQREENHRGLAEADIVNQDSRRSWTWKYTVESHINNIVGQWQMYC